MTTACEQTVKSSVEQVYQNVIRALIWGPGRVGGLRAGESRVDSNLAKGPPKFSQGQPQRKKVENLFAELKN